MNKEILNLAILGRDPSYFTSVEKMLQAAPALPAKTVAFAHFADFLEREADSVSFDVLLLDFDLSDAEGVSSFVELAKKYPALPKIVLTERGNSDLSEKILSLGAHDFLLKSHTSAEVLKRTISHVLARQDFQQRLFTKTDQFRMAAKMARLGRWEVDFDPIEISWSDGICRIHEVENGFAPTLENALDFYVPEHRPEVEAAFAACVETGKPFSGAWEILSAKGNHLWVKVMGDCVRDGSGKITKVYGTLQDVTDMHLSQAHLKLLQECVRHISDAVLICDATAQEDKGPAILFVNEAFTAMTGYSSAEIIGKSPEFLLGEKTSREARQKICEALLMAEPIRQELVIYDKEDRSKWIEIEITPIFDANGDLANFVGIQRDITERKARESTASFQARILENVGQSVLVTDPEGIITYNNKTAENYFGLSSSELRGRLVTDATVADTDLERAFEVLIDVQNGGDWTGEILAKHSSGREFPVLVSACATYDDEGNLDKMLAFATDISERREMEEALRLSLRDNLDLKQALDRHVIVSITDPDGQITFVNENFCEISGYEEDDLIGNHHSMLDREWETSPSADEMFEVLSTGRSWKGEIRSFRKDSSVFWTDTTVVPFLDERDEPRQYLFLRSDTTDRKRAEEELRLQASFINRSNDAIIATDLEDKITFWNHSASRIYGWSAEEAMGKQKQELLSGNCQDAVEASKAVREAGEWSGEMNHTTKNGSEIIVEASWTFVAGENSQNDSIFSINKDITETRDMELQFFRSQRMESVGRLAGGIAHDLNNMLTPILLSVDILRQDEVPPSSVAIMDMLEGSATRAAELVKQVLMFSKGVDGKRKPVSVVEVADEVVSIARETFPKNITVQGKFEDGVDEILGDNTQIHQIIMNLCVNARDAMEDGGLLTIHAGVVSIDAGEANAIQEVPEGRYVVISVQDTGMGIPSETMEKIFDPFFTTKEIGKGSGIGLSTSLAIVKSHGGFMDVRSEVGNGTQFKVYLPTCASEEEPGEESSPRDMLSGGAGELILLVDDEVAIRTIGKRILERAGYSVLIAKNGAEGAAIYAKHVEEISAVVTDMAMPIMDGNALIIALKTINPDVRILVTSGHTTSGRYLGEGTEAIKHFIPKPFSLETLLPAVADLLSAKKGDGLALAQ